MKTDNRLTKQRLQVIDNVRIVCKSLGLTYEEYESLQYQESVRWLRIRLQCNEYRLLNRIALNELFTKWWLNQWAIREASFVRDCNLNEINEVLTGNAADAARQLWLELHNAPEIYLKMNVFVQKEVYDLVNGEIEKTK